MFDIDISDLLNNMFDISDSNIYHEPSDIDFNIISLASKYISFIISQSTMYWLVVLN